MGRREVVFLNYVISLVLTVLVEGVFALAWGLRGRDLGLLVLVNALTNPLVVLIHGLTEWVVLPELWAIGTEWFLYRTLENQLKKPFLFALGANLFSYTVGEILQLIIY